MKLLSSILVGGLAVIMPQEAEATPKYSNGEPKPYRPLWKTTSCFGKLGSWWEWKRHDYNRLKKACPSGYSYHSAEDCFFALATTSKAHCLKREYPSYDQGTPCYGGVNNLEKGALYCQNQFKGNIDGGGTTCKDGGQFWKCTTIEGDSMPNCFGAMGSNCGGIKGFGVTPGDGGKLAWTSVGSILHDNCCIRTGNYGVGCGNADKDWHNTDYLGVGDEDKACAKEWKHAIGDVAKNYMWAAWYENNLTDSGTGEYGNQLTPARTSYLKENCVFGLFCDLKKNVWDEAYATRRLKAPPSTKLRWTDRAFCASGKMRRSNDDDYGYCV